MTDDLVVRLREFGKHDAYIPVTKALMAEAADRIEALEVALRDAQSGLRYIRTRYGALDGVGWDRVLPGTDHD